MPWLTICSAWARAGFVLVVPTGFMMFTAHATEFADNPVFRLKLVLIAAAVANAGAFHQWPFKSCRVGTRARIRPRWAKAAAHPLACSCGRERFVRTADRLLLSRVNSEGASPPADASP